MVRTLPSQGSNMGSNPVASTNMTDEEKRLNDWIRVCEQPLYQFLKFGEGKRILNLLFDQQISPGKAAQSIVEMFNLGIVSVLPEEKDEKETR